MITPTTISSLPHFPRNRHHDPLHQKLVLLGHRNVGVVRVQRVQRDPPVLPDELPERAAAAEGAYLDSSTVTFQLPVAFTIK